MTITKTLPASLPRMLIDLSTLPDISATEMDFRDTSFFQACGSPTPQLPSPSVVRQTGRGKIAVFEHLNLLVKMGHPTRVPLEEALTMRAVRKAFSNNEVPVPEVFGWRVSDGDNFIYMSLVRGPTLREAWTTLTYTDKESICKQLAGIVTHLRLLRHNSPYPFIG
jgi:hypothetical protein